MLRDLKSSKLLGLGRGVSGILFFVDLSSQNCMHVKISHLVSCPLDRLCPNKFRPCIPLVLDGIHCKTYRFYSNVSVWIVNTLTKVLMMIISCLDSLRVDPIKLQYKLLVENLMIVLYFFCLACPYEYRCFLLPHFLCQ